MTGISPAASSAPMEIQKPTLGGSQRAPSVITPATTNVQPPTRCVSRYTRSLSSVHGVRIPIHQFERILGR